MSQILFIFLYLFSYLFSKIDEIKTMTHITNLRHHSLHPNVFHIFRNFHNCTFHTKRDIDVQKIKVKNTKRILPIDIQGLPKNNGDPRLFCHFIAISVHKGEPENNGD